MTKHLLLILLFYFQCAQSQPSDTNISNGFVFDGEPYLAMDPTNPQHLVSAWMGIKLSNGEYRIAIKNAREL